MKKSETAKPSLNIHGKTLRNPHIVEEAIHGSSDAMRQLIEFYYEDLLYFAISKVGVQEGQDVAQRAVGSIIESIQNLKDPSKVKSWMLSVTNNRCMDHMKERQQTYLSLVHEEDLEEQTLHNIQDENTEHFPEEALLNKETRNKVIDIIEGLPMNYADCLRLRYFEGLSVKEIAEVLEISPKKVDNDLYNGKKLFKKHFEQSSHTNYRYSLAAIGIAPALTQAFQAHCAEVITPQMSAQFLAAANEYITAHASSMQVAQGLAATTQKAGISAKVLGTSVIAVSTIALAATIALTQLPTPAPAPSAALAHSLSSIAHTSLGATPQNAAQINTIADMIGTEDAALLASFEAAQPSAPEWQSFIARIGATTQDYAAEPQNTYRIYLLEKQDKQLLLFEKQASQTGAITVLSHFGIKEDLPHIMDVILMFE